MSFMSSVLSSRRCVSWWAFLSCPACRLVRRGVGRSVSRRHAGDNGASRQAGGGVFSWDMRGRPAFARFTNISSIYGYHRALIILSVPLAFPPLSDELGRFRRPVPRLVSCRLVGRLVFSSCHAVSYRAHAFHLIRPSIRLVFFSSSFIIRSVVRSSSCGLLGVCPIGAVGKSWGGAGAVSRFSVN